jgi:hypothetical protein
VERFEEDPSTKRRCAELGVEIFFNRSSSGMQVSNQLIFHMSFWCISCFIGKNQARRPRVEGHEGFEATSLDG